MDPKRIKGLRCSLTLHFAILAWLTAMLVASGSDSYLLPTLIFFVSLCGFIFVDSLQWFELGRIGSYVGMSIVTCIAIGGYLYSVLVVESESGQLAAVAGLLVYPECVLFLQRKTLRIYEQLAIFLLLEMIVAALINDNLLFGILLTPIMLLWVSSLFLFSRYSTLVHIDPTIDNPVPQLFEVLYRKFVKPMFRQPRQPATVSSQFLASAEVQSGNSLRRFLQTLPIGVGAIVFAAVFFYLLPRTTPGAFRSGLGVEPRTGLPSEMRMGIFGRLLQDPTPVMRVSFKSANSGQPYALEEPPYLRARVYEFYAGESRSRNGPYSWRASAGIPYYPQLAAIESVDSYVKLGADVLLTEFDISREYATTLFAVPPAFASKQKQRITLYYDDQRMLLEPLDPAGTFVGKSLVYEVGTAGFADHRQLRIVPANLPETGADILRRALLLPIINFRDAEAYRQQILKAAGCSETELFKAAKAYEQHFVFSGDFSYSLDLRPPSDPDLDPIEDFLLNQRQGHCQYFAAGMVALLRQHGIPSRIVGGYRPTEFNSYGYFSVRQSDAHAWVEGLFSREQLENTELAGWLSPQIGSYWVRFDPTPAADGGVAVIVQQPGQAMDFAQKLWKDYVVDAQKLSRGNSLYSPVSEDSENAYQSTIERLKKLIVNLREGKFLNGEGIDFSWPLALLIFIAGGSCIAVWRLAWVLPRSAPSLARKLGLEPMADRELKQAFFARCVALLGKRGLHRRKWQTPGEFTSEAAELLAAEGHSTDLSSPLDMLTQHYYRLRFGNQQSLSSGQAQEIEQALDRLETVAKASNRKRKLAKTNRA